ncbi:hypothetical protein AYO22_11055 [Fonsecaea multimorphosa]|nr:hypothetical protein AYO22_11055 [Fonsecaea multimorphosa]
MSLRNAVKELRRGIYSSHPAPSSPYLPTTLSHTQPVHSASCRNFLEDTLDSDFDSEEAPPPYMKLSNGDTKPEYSRADPAKTIDANLSRMDGALCLRCNARKAKAWYLRQTGHKSQQITYRGD